MSSDYESFALDFETLSTWLTQLTTGAVSTCTCLVCELRSDRDMTQEVGFSSFFSITPIRFGPSKLPTRNKREAEENGRQNPSLEIFGCGGAGKFQEWEDRGLIGMVGYSTALTEISFEEKCTPLLDDMTVRTRTWTSLQFPACHRWMDAEMMLPPTLYRDDPISFHMLDKCTDLFAPESPIRCKVVLQQQQQQQQRRRASSQDSYIQPIILVKVCSRKREERKGKQRRERIYGWAWQDR
ncbi:hypothetical protein QBC35DRAFT_535181 [Podospora australis]|uniref:Uncharacterized protein n=1 Tax=Podospora australis TaxID=1536484 RepID=A0AAN7AEF5_9PEZI|nr:hypothetical protein QBC35DRAFT_535181 [Podospora australis]